MIKKSYSSQKTFVPFEKATDFNQLSSVTGFTLLELTIVVIILGILTAFAVPAYMGVVQRAKQKNVTAMLFLIKNAEKVYYAKNGTYYVATNAPIGAINTNLNISIIQPADILYQCSGSTSDFSCTGYHPQTAPQWNINITSTTGPTCTATGGTCY